MNKNLNKSLKKNQLGGLITKCKLQTVWILIGTNQLKKKKSKKHYETKRFKYCLNH